MILRAAGAILLIHQLADRVTPRAAHFPAFTTAARMRKRTATRVTRRMAHQKPIAQRARQAAATPTERRINPKRPRARAVTSLGSERAFSSNDQSFRRDEALGHSCGGMMHTQSRRDEVAVAVASGTTYSSSRSRSGRSSLACSSFRPRPRGNTFQRRSSLLHHRSDADHRGSPGPRASPLLMAFPRDGR
jgi:hypothetical protein